MLIPFKARFERHFIPEPNTGCWIWTSAQNGMGYGVLRNSDGKNQLAHRLSYEINKGPIPDKMVLDHLCRNKCCVNPDHLEAVTQRENYLRGYGPRVNGKYQKEKTACPYGHPYAGDNLYIRVGIGRSCKECARIRSREFQRKKRAAA